jgi:hypothetical protein
MDLEDYEELLTADDLDDAIIGIGRRCGQPDLVVYDVEKVINILMSRDGMTYDDALEFYEYNMAGAWVGDSTPIWMESLG